jgi:transcriptional regulator with AAA-type ATPase domain
MPESGAPSSAPGEADRALVVSSFFGHHGLSFFELMLRALRQHTHLPFGGESDPEESHSQADLLGGLPPAAEVNERVEGALLVPKDLKRSWVSTNWRRYASPEELHALVEHRLLKTDIRAKIDVDAWELKVDGTSRLDLRKALATVPGQEHELWPIVKECGLDQQLDWLERFNLWKVSGKTPPFKVHRLDYDGDSTDDPYAWTRAAQRWMREQQPQESVQVLVNLHGTPTMNQLAWYYLAWSDPALKRATFIACSTPRPSSTRESGPYRDMRVQRLRTQLLHELSTKPRNDPRSPAQVDAEEWLKFYKRCGDYFVVLVLGERGTGKSESVKRVFDCQSVNCGEFGHDITMARSRLFGHLKGAFTGAVEERKGAFAVARGEALFLDEIHLLTPEMQGALLTALATNSAGEFTFTPLGASKEVSSKFQLIVGSNLSHKELQKKLEPDFYDRICQRRVTFPPVSKVPDELRYVWNSVWNGMEFQGLTNPTDIDGFGERFLDWLCKLELPGNYRDLQRLAVLVADVVRAEKFGLHAEPKDGTWLDRAQHLWVPGPTRDQPQPEIASKQEPDTSSQSQDIDDTPISPEMLADPNRFIADQRKRIANQLIERYGSARDAAKNTKPKISEATLYRWQKGAVQTRAQLRQP